MRGRSLDKRIEIWGVGTPVSNGFGGYDTVDSLITTTWAKVSTVKAGSNVADLGIVDANRAVKFTIRKSSTLTVSEEVHYIKYRDKKYTINTAPTNTDFQDTWITFIGIRETVKSNTAG